MRVFFKEDNKFLTNFVAVVIVHLRHDAAEAVGGVVGTGDKLTVFIQESVERWIVLIIAVSVFWNPVGFPDNDIVAILVHCNGRVFLDAFLVIVVDQSVALQIGSFKFIRIF